MSDDPADEVKRGGRFDGAPSPVYEQELARMVRRAGRPDMLPWSPRLTRRLARELWETLEPFINSPEPPPSPSGFDVGAAFNALRRTLDRILAGNPPTLIPDRPLVVKLPLWLVVLPDGRTYWTADIACHDDMLEADLWRQFVDDAGGSLMALLWSSDVRPLLQRCGRCGHYELLEQRPRRPYLCSPTCAAARKRERERATGTERQREFRRRTFTGPPK